MNLCFELNGDGRGTAKVIDTSLNDRIRDRIEPFIRRAYERGIEDGKRRALLKAHRNDLRDARAALMMAILDAEIAVKEKPHDPKASARLKALLHLVHEPEAFESLSGVVVKGFDENEPRDDHGRWKAIGGGERKKTKVDVPDDEGEDAFDVSVIRNPNAVDIKSKLANLRSRNPIRGIVHGDDVHIWWDEDVHHTPTARALGIKGNIDFKDRLFIHLDRDTGEVTVESHDHNPRLAEWAKKHGFAYAGEGAVAKSFMAILKARGSWDESKHKRDHGKFAPIEEAAPDRMRAFAHRALRSNSKEDIDKHYEAGLKKIKAAFRKEWKEIVRLVGKNWGKHIADHADMNEVKSRLNQAYQTSLRKLSDMREDIYRDAEKGWIGRKGKNLERFELYEEDANLARKELSDHYEAVMNTLALVIARHHGSGGKDVIKAVLLKARGSWDESKHPRDDHGRFVSRDAIAEARDAAKKGDHSEADQLRARVTNPDERAKLDAALGGDTDLGRTKRGQTKDAAGKKRDAKGNASARLRELRLKAVAEGLTTDDLRELTEHLQHATVDELKRTRTALGASFHGDRKKADMLKRLNDWAKAEGERIIGERDSLDFGMEAMHEPGMEQAADAKPRDVAKEQERKEQVEDAVQRGDKLLPSPKDAAAKTSIPGHDQWRDQVTDPAQVTGRPKTKKARNDLARRLQNGWTEVRNALAEKLGTRDINDKMTPEMAKLEDQLHSVLETIVTGSERDGMFDLGPVSDARYAGYYRGAVKTLDQMRSMVADNPAGETKGQAPETGGSEKPSSGEVQANHESYVANQHFSSDARVDSATAHKDLDHPGGKHPGIKDEHRGEDAAVQMLVGASNAASDAAGEAELHAQAGEWVESRNKHLEAASHHRSLAKSGILTDETRAKHLDAARSHEKAAQAVDPDTKIAEIDAGGEVSPHSQKAAESSNAASERLAGNLPASPLTYVQLRDPDQPWNLAKSASEDARDLSAAGDSRGAERMHRTAAKHFEKTLKEVGKYLNDQTRKAVEKAIGHHESAAKAIESERNLGMVTGKWPTGDDKTQGKANGTKSPATEATPDEPQEQQESTAQSHHKLADAGEAHGRRDGAQPWEKSGADRIRALRGSASPATVAEAVKNYATSDQHLSNPVGKAVDALARNAIAGMTHEQRQELTDHYRAASANTGQTAPAMKDLLAEHEPKKHREMRADALSRLDKIQGLSPEARAAAEQSIRGAKGEREADIADAVYGAVSDAKQSVSSVSATPGGVPQSWMPGGPSHTNANIPNRAFAGGIGPHEDAMRDRHERQHIGAHLRETGKLTPSDAIKHATADGATEVIGSKAETVLVNRLGLSESEAKKVVSGLKPVGKKKFPGGKHDVYDVLDLYRATGKLAEGGTPPPDAATAPIDTKPKEQFSEASRTSPVNASPSAGGTGASASWMPGASTSRPKPEAPKGPKPLHPLGDWSRTSAAGNTITPILEGDVTDKVIHKVEHSKGYTGKRSGKSWLAEIGGASKEYGFDRNFLDTNDTDWGDYDSRKGKGSYHKLHSVKPGVYEHSDHGDRSYHIYFRSRVDGKPKLMRVKANAEDLKGAYSAIKKHGLSNSDLPHAVARFGMSKGSVADAVHAYADELRSASGKPAVAKAFIKSFRYAKYAGILSMLKKETALTA